MPNAAAVTTKQAALCHTCPRCQQPPGHPCNDRSGHPRASVHIQRHETAIAAGARPITPDAPTLEPTHRLWREPTRQLRARWNRQRFTCDGPCARHFDPYTIRTVYYRGGQWCDRDYRTASGHT